MAAKIDKEFLIKNQFWVGLGAFVLLWLIGVIMVMVGPDATAKKDWKDAKDGVERSRNPKTAADQIPWNNHGKMYRDQKDVIWAEAWKHQAAMYTWPQGMAVVPLYIEDRFGHTSTEDLNERAKFRTDLYKLQFEGLPQVVAPVEFLGGFAEVFPPQRWDASRPPTREEIWLAQEDFWVRREMLAIVRDALNSVAWFHEVKLDEKDRNPKGFAGRRVFRNANWELNLLLEKGTGRRLLISDKSTLKNISPSGRTLPLASPRTHGPLEFRLWQTNGRFELKVSGEPVPAGADPVPVTKQALDPDPLNLAEPFYVEQVLEWEVSPIRRIDVLDVARPSHRTVTVGLKVREDLKKLDPEPPPEAGSPSGGPPAGGGDTGGPSMSPAGGGSGGRGSAMAPGSMGGMGGMGGNQPQVESTRINQIPRPRYQHVKEQARHLPIGMRLIVDQDHIHDVLTAVANSRLRIQTTQVSMHQAPNVTRGTQQQGGGYGGMGSPGPAAAGMTSFPGMSGPRGMGGFRPPTMSAGVGGASPPRGSSGDMRPGSMRPPTSPRPAPGTAGTGAAGTGEGGTTPADHPPGVQDSARLVELSIFGIATLYERFPPRKKDGASGQPAK
jgi:hypothetical protein